MKRSGFTLIELSIVLIIIGLIIGGVMKGKDLIASAQQKKIYNTWVKQWQVTANEYQDRTGAILGDGPNNGGTATENGLADNFYADTQGTIDTALEGVGLDIPVSNISGTKGAKYRIKGKYTTQLTRIYFYNVGGVNYIRFISLPTDIAIAFDKMADGTVDASAGSFKLLGQAPSTTPVPWGNAKTTKTVQAILEY